LPRPLFQIAVIAGLAGVALARVAFAQTAQPEGGPVVVGAPHESWRDFEIEHVEAALEFLGQHRQDKLRQAFGPTLVDRETLLRETLNISGEASIGHKNLFDLTGSAQLGLEDRFTDSDSAGMTTHESDFLNLYDVRGLILGNSAFPVTAYARREQSLIDRAFAGTIDSTLTEYGVIGQLQSDRAPTTVQYFHRTQEQSDQFGLTGSTVTQDTFTGQSGILINQSQHLDIAYTFDHVDEESVGAPGDTYDRHDANIVHTLDFGPESRPHELRSSFRIYDQGGRFAQQDLRWDELLVLRHSDRLETRYTTSVDRQERGGESQWLYRADASIRHRLFESLVSTATVGAQRFQAPGDFQSDDWFVTGQLDYTKKAAPGRIDASAGASYDAQSNSPRGGTASVINEAHIFNDPFPIVLSRRHIVPGSIVVTPPSGFPAYVEGIDYTVRIFPDRAELTVLPASAILDGSTVLASYDVGPEPGSDIDTTGTTFSFRYTLTDGLLQGLAGYTTYRTIDHHLSTEDPSAFVLDDVRDLLVGVEYNRAGLDVKLEHEDHDSTVSPSDTDRFMATYLQPLGRNSALSLQLTHEIIDYQMPDNRVQFDRATARWDQRLNPSFDFNLRLEYRNERDSLAGDSEGFEQLLGFNWHRGQTTIYGSVRNVFLDGPSTETTSQLFQLGLRRAF
jgi:hypothetical protein